MTDLRYFRMKKWNLTHNSHNIISDINITPLTDVMLVLLVIFMVTTPLLVMESFKIKLPKAVTADVEPGKGINISITPEKIIYLNNKIVELERLLDALKAELTSASEKNVVIKADKNIPHGMVVKVLDTAKQAGAEKLSIATEPEK